MKFEKMLPIGSVVCMKGTDTLLMIMGCNQVNSVTKRLYDYSAVLFPMGFIDSRHVYMFDHEDIDRVYAVGYLDEESRAFQAIALEDNKRLRTGKMTIESFLGAGRRP